MLSNVTFIKCNIALESYVILVKFFLRNGF